MLETIRKNAAKFFLAMTLGAALVAAAPAQAQTVVEVQSGTDNTTNLGAVNSVARTAVGFMLNVVARVVGVGLGLFAIFQFVKREIVWGVVSIVLCGVCFTLPQIIQGVANMGAATGTGG